MTHTLTPVDSRNVVLLVMDYQAGILDRSDPKV
jgi:hypothetical protein